MIIFWIFLFLVYFFIGIVIFGVLAYQPVQAIEISLIKIICASLLWPLFLLCLFNINKNTALGSVLIDKLLKRSAILAFLIFLLYYLI